MRVASLTRSGSWARSARSTASTGAKADRLDGRLRVVEIGLAQEDRHDDVAALLAGCAAHHPADRLDDVHGARARIDEGDRVEARHVDALGEAAGVRHDGRAIRLPEERQDPLAVVDRHRAADVLRRSGGEVVEVELLERVGEVPGAGDGVVEA